METSPLSVNAMPAVIEPPHLAAGNGPVGQPAAYGRAIDTDKWIYRLVVGLLGVVMLSGMLGSLILTLRGVEKIPDIFVALGSAAVGALAGLLAPSPRQS
jgi:hypothetical protein